MSPRVPLPHNCQTMAPHRLSICPHTQTKSPVYVHLPAITLTSTDSSVSCRAAMLSSDRLWSDDVHAYRLLSSSNAYYMRLGCGQATATRRGHETA